MNYWLHACMIDWLHADMIDWLIKYMIDDMIVYIHDLYRYMILVEQITDLIVWHSNQTVECVVDMKVSHMIDWMYSENHVKSKSQMYKEMIKWSDK